MTIFTCCSNSPEAYCPGLGTPNQTKGKLLVALGIILVLSPIIVGSLRLANMAGLGAITRPAANWCIAIGSITLIFMTTIGTGAYCQHRHYKKHPENLPDGLAGMVANPGGWGEQLASFLGGVVPRARQPQEHA